MLCLLLPTGVLFIIATGLSFALCISVVVARRILDPKGLENFSFQRKLTRNVIQVKGGSRGCSGCPDTRPFDTVPFFEKNLFSKRAPIRRILGFWGNKVPQNERFHAQDDQEPSCKIWRR